MNRVRISLFLVWLLAIQHLHHASAQGGLTTFFTTGFATYSAEEQVIDVTFTIEAPTSVGTPPLSLTTVLDRSGSMQGNKIELLKKTTQFLVNKLSEGGGGQSMGLVTYSDGVEEVSGVVPVDSSNAPLLNNLVASIQAGGQTNLAGGLVKGVEQQKAAPGGKIKSVYLFTDGLPTVGPASGSEILSQVNAAKSGGDQITISTFGFGSDLDAGLLKGISDSAGGATYIISNEEDIPKAFGDALGGLLSTAAQDITVTFKGEGGATIESIESGGTTSDVEGGKSVRFPNLFAEEKRDILLRIKIPAGSDKLTVANAQVSYVDGSSLQRVSKDPQSVTIDRSGAAPEGEAADEKVEKTKLRFDTAKALAEAKSKADAGDSSGAATAIATAIANVEVSPVKDDPTIQALLADVQKIKELLETQGSASSEKVEELEDTLKEQRSVGTDLESGKAVDTSKRRETRQEAADEVAAAPPADVDPTLPTTGTDTGTVTVPGPTTEGGLAPPPIVEIPAPGPATEVDLAPPPTVEIPAPGPTVEPTATGPTAEPTTTATGPTAEPVTTTPGPTAEPVTITPGPTAEPVTITPGPTAEPVTTTPGPTAEPVTVAPGPTAEAVTTTPGPTAEPVTTTPAEPTAEPVTTPAEPTAEPVTTPAEPTAEPVTAAPGPTAEAVTAAPAPTAEPVTTTPQPTAEAVTTTPQDTVAAPTAESGAGDATVTAAPAPAVEVTDPSGSGDGSGESTDPSGTGGDVTLAPVGVDPAAGDGSGEFTGEG